MQFQFFANEYMQIHSKVHNKTWKEDERRLKLYLLPAFSKKELTDITRGEVARLHAHIGSTKPYVANRVREQLHAMYRRAMLWGYVEHNPAAGIKDFKEVERKRFLDDGEMLRLFMSIHQEPNTYLRASILLFLFTGLRKNEVLKLRWDFIKNRVAYLPDSKNGEPIMHPLSEQAMMVLLSLPKVKGNPYVFAGRNPGKHLSSGMSKSWHRIRTRAKIDDVRIHDLRRTVGAWLTQSGFNLRIVQDVLNHKSLKSTLVYARLNLSDKTKALEYFGSAAGEILTASGFEFPLVDNSAPSENQEVKLSEQFEIKKACSRQGKRNDIKVPKNSSIQIAPADQVIIEANIIKTLKSGGKTKKDMYKRIGGKPCKINSENMERILNGLIERGLIEKYTQHPHYTALYRVL